MSKNEDQKTLADLEKNTAKLIDVDNIPEGDLNNMVAQSIKSEPVKETVSEEKDTVFIYCGPTNNQISRYTSYKNGYPFHLKTHLEKCPALKIMFVLPEDFSKFEKNVVQKGTVENIFFEEVKKYFSKAVS